MQTLDIGSIYFILFIAAAQKGDAFLKFPVKFTKALTNILRQPTEQGEIGHLVRENLIPSIASLRQSIQFLTKPELGSRILQGHQLPPVLDFANFKHADIFLDAMNRKYVYDSLF